MFPGGKGNDGPPVERVYSIRSKKKDRGQKGYEEFIT